MQYVISDSDRVFEDMHYTGARSALEIHPDGKPYHTFRTATVLVTGKDLTFRRCSFANTAGPGKTAAQAIALYLDGDGIRLEDCILEGHQDTLFLAPLPPKEIQKDGFLGPG
jgi:pectinesterase